MVKKNPNFSKLATNYLFPEIQKKRKAFLEKFPGEKIISLGIGDTTQPLSLFITENISKAANGLATVHEYSGYGPEQGHPQLRKMIAETFYKGFMQPDEIFISDGAKCDTGRLLNIFGKGLSIAVQDPTYPVYVDTSILTGQAGKIVYMACSAENDFFPDLQNLDPVDIIFFCSPNNPTGSTATKEQLRKLVDFALERKALLIYDAAYSFFIKDNQFPRTIFEIEGADQTAIEISSFSKLAGFTGLRLSWTAIPRKVLFEDGSTLHQAWNRITTTFFNGASNLSQVGGIAALQDKGLKDLEKTRDYYLKNADLIRETFQSLGYKAYGGVNAPYVWVDFHPKKSWEMFDELLNNTQVISVPGSGFGPAGEGFLRFSAFGYRENVLEALARITEYLTK
jgi:LL-diaminopimelate aminotransferase